MYAMTRPMQIARQRPRNTPTKILPPFPLLEDEVVIRVGTLTSVDVGDGETAVTADEVGSEAEINADVESSSGWLLAKLLTKKIDVRRSDMVDRCRPIDVCLTRYVLMI